MALAGFLSGVSPHFSVLMLFRFLVGFGVGGSNVPLDLFAEFLPSTLRGKLLATIEVFWTIGSLFVAGIAWAVLNHLGWRALAYISTIPVALTCMISFWSLPESPKWLFNQGREQDAYQSVLKFMSLNNSLRGEPAAIAIPETRYRNSTRIATGENVNLFFELLGPSLLWISVPLWVVWFCFGFSYYGIILLVARIFSDSDSATMICSFDYQSIFQNTSAEIVGVVLVTAMIDTVGRTRTQSILYASAALAILLVGSTKNFIAYSVFVFIARLTSFAATSATCVATPELYPTAVRATGHSVCLVISRVGAFFSPYLVNNSSSVLYMCIVMSLVNLVAAAVSLLLPETRGVQLESKRPEGIITNEEDESM